MTNEIHQGRQAVLDKHFQSEVDHDWDTCIATFGDVPRYEIMATGQVHVGEAEVRAYHAAQRTAFPDQHHENVRFHYSDDCVIAEFDLVGTYLGEFYGMPPNGRSFRVPVIAVFFFDGIHITNERIYLDAATLLAQIGRSNLLALAGASETEEVNRASGPPTSARRP